MKKAAIFSLLIILTVSVYSQDKEPQRSRFYIETDPLPLFLGGVSGHFGWSPAKLPSFTFGLGLAGGIEYPDAFINMTEENRDQGWEVRINQGMGIWAHYHFSDDRNGWFAGIQLFTQEMRLKNADFPGETDDTNTVMMSLQGGYLWYPFSKAGFYLRPWGGFGFQSTVSGSFEPDRVDPDLIVGDKGFVLARFMPFATVHIGYSF